MKNEVVWKTMSRLFKEGKKAMKSGDSSKERIRLRRIKNLAESGIGNLLEEQEQGVKNVSRKRSTAEKFNNVLSEEDIRNIEEDLIEYGKHSLHLKEQDAKEVAKIMTSVLKEKQRR